MYKRQAYGEALAQLVKQNPDIVVLDADLAGSTKTSEAKKAVSYTHLDVYKRQVVTDDHALFLCAVSWNIPTT